MQLGVGMRASVTLEPARYELATTAGDEWDDNWLFIRGMYRLLMRCGSLLFRV
jgi:hypothetical protein